MSPRLIAALATCAVLASAPVLADRGHGRGHGFYRQPPKHVVVKRTVVYREAPRVVYRAAPRVVYGAPAYYPAPVVAYAPAPVYVGYGGHYRGGHDDDAWKWVAGGALAGAILYSIDH
jgi:hypothetical protein